jgi:glycine/D-amino acid oxidase-like deaminating enzyme
MGYGRDEIYTRWSQNSLVQWKKLFAKGGDRLFHQTGVLWLSREGDERLPESVATLERCGIKHEVIERAALEKRYPQVNFDGVERGLLEPDSGVLMARRAVACVAEDVVKRGARLEIAQIVPPLKKEKLEGVETTEGKWISAGQFVFACGPWLGKMFPELLGPRIFPTRQEVFFFGTPPGDRRFAPPDLPTWLFTMDEVYGMPDLEGRGLKVALDTHGMRIDPDTQSRMTSPEITDWARRYVARRFPALKDALIVETRVCQYENTSNGDFLIDRHPDLENVWFAGGGSGHGFKHGPAFGEYMASLVCGKGKAEARFSLPSKSTVQNRAVY